MQIITIAGALGRDAEFKTTRDGTGFCSFSVAVNSGWGEHKTVTWFDVTRWGKGADKLSELLRKGGRVTVSGELTPREHNGRTYLQVRADHVTLQGDAQRGGGQRGRERREQADDGWHALPPDDEVPF